MAKKPVRAKKKAPKATRKPARKPASKAAKPTLHGAAPSGPTYKVALMFALCGKPISFRHTALRYAAHKTTEFLKIYRYGQVPALVDAKLTLCQSGAILEYLADKYKKFAGKDAQQRARAREWLFWDADRLSPGVFRTRAAARGVLTI